MIFDATLAEKRIGYVFKNKMLLRQCFTHSSYTNEHKNEKNNERLEFFGDAILDMVITEYLYDNTDKDEGVMTKERASLVSRIPLQEVIMDLGLEDLMLKGNGTSSDRGNEKLVISLFEAIVAGIYIDGGMANAKKFIIDKLIKKSYAQSKKVCDKQQPNGDNKSRLQELAQSKKLGKVEYKLLKKSGPDHKPTFTVSVSVDGKVLANGTASSKKLAEMQAAGVALEILTKKKKSKK
ncbi:MAG: ribonuclease III [Clostridia bacterium]|nr:ribonuclease III [Clostridia bacterium]